MPDENRNGIFDANNEDERNEGDKEEKELQMQNEEDELKEKLEGKIICSSCGKENPQTNLFCSFCGKPFVKKVSCQRCGAEVPIFNSFCSHCGAPMKAPSSVSSQMTSSSPSSFQATTSPRSYSQSSTSSSGRGFMATSQQANATYLERVKQARLEHYNSIGTIVGVLLILIGIGGIGIMLLMLLTLSSEAFKEILGEEMLVGLGSFYGLLIAMFLVPSLIALFSGTALIRYRPNNNAWKGFYYSLRYFFLGLSGLLAIISLVTIIGWTFYVSPEYTLSGNLIFWLFTELSIPVKISAIALWVILLVSLLVCLGLLITPTIITFIKTRKESTHTTEIKLISEDPLEEKSLDSFAKEKPQPKKIELEKNKEKLSEVEIKKGRMSGLFYKIKGSPLVKSLELFGASYFLSFILILLLPTAGEDVPPIEEYDPIVAIISLALAGITEEISFRLICIGVPMIFVVLGRFLLENTSQGQELQTRLRWKKNNATAESKEDRNQPSLSIKDIPLAIRGKYKRIGIPEWVLITFSSLIFGFAHWEKWTGSWPFWKVFQAALMGLFLSYAFVKYGIESAILIHFINNVLSGLGVFASEIGAEWLSGLATFFTFTILIFGFMKVSSFTINTILWYNLRKAKTADL